MIESTHKFKGKTFSIVTLFKVVREGFHLYESKVNELPEVVCFALSPEESIKRSIESIEAYYENNYCWV